MEAWAEVEFPTEVESPSLGILKIHLVMVLEQGGVGPDDLQRSLHTSAKPVFLLGCG